MEVSADRNLLFGLLALQMDFLDSEALIKGMQDWMLNKSVSLANILVKRGSLQAQHQALLEPLVAAHVAKHDDDPRQSLAALSSMQDMAASLRQLTDPDLNASLGFVSSEISTGDCSHVIASGTSSRTREDGAAETMIEPEHKTGRFRIVRPHAEGGLGKVSVAIDEEFNREVAFKEIKSQHSSNHDARTRFLVEGEITGGLEHPGIVPVYGLGQFPDGRPFYAMRFIRGESLHDAIRSFHRLHTGTLRSGHGSHGGTYETNLEFRKLIGRFIDVCHAIEYAHSRGVLHRDLKPGNIMLGKFGETLVVDWGLAKSRSGSSDAVVPNTTDIAPVETPLIPLSGSESTPTVMGEALGTPRYMSPEQASGRLDQLGPATDIYSLGATLFELLTGWAPIGAQPDSPEPERLSLPELLRRVREGEFPEPRELNAQVPRALQAVCMKALAQQPQDRHSSAQALADDLECWLADEPVSDFVESFSVRSRRWMKHHRALVGSTVASVIVLIGALSVVTVLVSRHGQELAGRNTELETLNTQLETTRSQAEQERDNAQAARDIAMDARKSADQAREKAEEDRRLAEETSKVLTEILGSADQKRVGRTFTIVDLLDGAVQDIEQRFSDQPAVKASLLYRIGLAYRGHAEPQKALAVLEQALQIRQKISEKYDRANLPILNHLALAYADVGRRAEARTIYEEALPRLEATYGEKHEIVVITIHNLGEVYFYMGNTRHAQTLFERALKIKEETHGKAHRDTARTVIMLGRVRLRLGDAKQGIPLLERARDTRVQSYKTLDHLRVLDAMRYLAIGYQCDGQYQLAKPLLDEVVARSRKVLGEKDRRTRTAERLVSYAAKIEELEPRFLKDELSPGMTSRSTLLRVIELARAYLQFYRYPQNISV